MSEKTEKLQLTPRQNEAFEAIKQFLNDDQTRIFVLKGYAGTGKTTLIRFLADYLKQRKKSFKLAAPTGRAVRVLDEKVNIKRFLPAFFIDVDSGLLVDETSMKSLIQDKLNTVHGHIYAPLGLNFDPKKILDAPKGSNLFSSWLHDYLEKLNKREIIVPPELRRRMENDKDDYKLYFGITLNEKTEVFIVDEASMIADTFSHDNKSHALFGSGRLLRDLFTSFPGTKFIFIGDDAQLPPVGSRHSPALDPAYLEKNYDLPVRSFELTEVLRIPERNDLLKAATLLRFQTEVERKHPLKFYLRGLKNIHLLETDENLQLYTFIIKSYMKKYGPEEGLFKALRRHIFIALTNKTVHDFNRIIRRSIFPDTNDNLHVHDIMMITQNNMLNELNNGDFIQIRHLGKSHSRSGLRFREVKIKRLSDNYETDTLIIEDIPGSGKANITPEQYRRLVRDFIIRLSQTEEFQRKPPHQRQEYLLQAMHRDPYLNALRAIHGYTVTCHKAQGGEWDHVHILLQNILARHSFHKPYNWVYTALTRSRKYAYLSSQLPVLPFQRVEAYVCEKAPELCKDD